MDSANPSNRLPSGGGTNHLYCIAISSQRMKKTMVGYDFLDGRIRRLVYQKSLPPRTPLACPLTFQRTVGSREAEPPRSAACSAEFRTQVRPQPSFTAPLVRPPPEHSTVAAHRRIACGVPGQLRRGRASGRDGRLRSSTCSKLRCACAAGGDSALRPQTVCRNIVRRANGFSGGSDF